MSLDRPETLILLTRPRRESRLTARALVAQGLASIRMPLQSTRRAPRTAALEAELGWAAGSPIQIFVSRAAVAAALSMAPATVAAAEARIAVGRATAAALANHVLSVISAPADAEDSDGVLGVPALQQVRGRRIAIWAAPGGRERIAQVLQARGAEVRMIPIYRRLPQRARPHALQQLRLHADRVVLTATSAALLDRLEQTLTAAGLGALRARPLVVVSARIAERARTLGYVNIHVARGAGFEALVAALANL